MIIYNAENQILGRLSTVIAKQLLKGEKVSVVNAEKAVLSGKPKMKQREYMTRYQRGDVEKGPFFPKQPDRIFRRTVRGMIPWHTTTGRNAYRNFKVFIGVPEELEKIKMKKIEKADASKLRTKYTTLGEISVSMGAKKRW